MEFGKFAKHLDHAVVVLKRMKTRPRKDVAAGFRVAVLRLMHVPQHNQMDAIHSAGVPKRGSRRWFVATGIDRIKVYRQEEPIAAPLLKTRNTASPPVCAPYNDPRLTAWYTLAFASCAFW